jgi:hypothetical protein
VLQGFDGASIATVNTTMPTTERKSAMEFMVPVAALNRISTEAGIPE